MTYTVDATVGGASANSFVTSAEMTTYCEARLNASTWTGAAAQIPALTEATRDLSVLAWQGIRVSSAQALAWPRDQVPDVDDPFQLYYSTTAIPQRIKDATCELALQYLKAGTTDLAALDSTTNVLRERVDVLETEYTAPGQRATGLARYPRVWALVRPLLESSGPTFRVERA